MRPLMALCIPPAGGLRLPTLMQLDHLTPPIQIRR